MNMFTVQILQILLKSGNVRLQTLTDSLGLTRRMVLYYQKQLNDFLSKENLGSTFLQDDALFLSASSDMQKIPEILETLDPEPVLSGSLRASGVYPAQNRHPRQTAVSGNPYRRVSCIAPHADERSDLYQRTAYPAQHTSSEPPEAGLLSVGGRMDDPLSPFICIPSQD